MKQLQDLLNRTVPWPEEWFEGMKNGETVGPAVEAMECGSYEELLAAWGDAVQMTYAIDVALTTGLAVIASTKLKDDQLWVRYIAKAGTLKTTICEALSGNREYVFTTSKFRGLHSGYTGPGAGEDSSLLPKMKDKTFILNEADVLLKLPNLNEVLSEFRDLYSGQTRANYRNGKMEEYLGWRTSVIIAGTNTIRELNRSAAGDRFLDCIIYEKSTHQEEKDLVRHILNKSISSMIVESNGQTATQLNPKLYIAYQKTSGYINYLRKTVELKLGEMFKAGLPKDFSNDCENLGQLVAWMRTRPTGKDEEPTEPELHVRLSKQLVKLGLCTAVVMNRPIDDEVMRRVARSARDTCYGHTFEACKALMGKATDARGITALIPNATEDGVRRALGILKHIGCVRVDLGKAESGALNRSKLVYRLTPVTAGLLTRLKILLADGVKTNA